MLISEAVPPMVSPVAIVLGRLLRQFPRGSYCVLTGSSQGMKYGLDPSGDRLDCEYYFAGLPKLLAGGGWGFDVSVLREFVRIPKIVLRGLQIIRTRNIRNIITTTYGGFEIAALILHVLTRKPLYVYLFDIYQESQLGRLKKLVAGIVERPLLRSASKVFVMSESLGEHINRKHGITCEFLPHPIDLAAFEGLSLPIEHPNHRRIVYTGMIYEAQRDSILDLVHAIANMEGVSLAIYSPRDPQCLLAEGIKGPNVSYRYVSHNEVPAVQRSADVLFLPMAFNSPYPAVIQTACPGKMPEYLAAGRPILVHAPPYAYVSQHARKYGFGLVVDRPDPEELREALLLLLHDKQLQDKLIENARRVVAMHDVKQLSGRLQDYLIA